MGSRNLINARAESHRGEVRVRAAPPSRRAPADGYYEWKKPEPGSPAKTKKQPFYLHPADGDVVALAGLYEFWKDPTKADDDPHRWVVSATVITHGHRLHEAHPRPPAPDAAPTLRRPWLDPAVGADGARELLDTVPEPRSRAAVSHGRRHRPQQRPSVADRPDGNVGQRDHRAPRR